MNSEKGKGKGLDAKGAKGASFAKEGDGLNAAGAGVLLRREDVRRSGVRE